jgi:hypothetical protein
MLGREKYKEKLEKELTHLQKLKLKISRTDSEKKHNNTFHSHLS